MSVNWYERFKKNVISGHDKQPISVGAAPEVSTFPTQEATLRDTGEPTKLIRPEFPIARTNLQPTGFWLTPGSTLEVIIWNTTGELNSVAIQGQVMDDFGRIREFSVDVTPTTDGVANIYLITLGSGFLISAGVYDTGNVQGHIYRGQTFIRGKIRRSAGSITPIYHATLFADYFFQNGSTSYPGSPIVSPTDGRGYSYVATSNDPAAGGNISITVPANRLWRFRSGELTIVADATVINRRLLITFDNGSIVFLKAVSPSNQTAGQTVEYCISSANLGVTTFASGAIFIGHTLQTIDTQVLTAGFRIRTSVDSLQAGDNLSAMVYQVEEWLDV